MTGTVEELNKIARPFGWWFNPEAPVEDVHKLVNILADWVDGLVAEERQRRIIQVACRKNRSKRKKRR